MYDFEKFSVYIASVDLQIILQPLLRNKKITKGLIDELDRASTSIILNIAEGAGKYSSKDKKNFYITARGSSQECVAILQILLARDLVEKGFYLDAYDKLETISKMLSGLINKMLTHKS